MSLNYTPLRHKMLADIEAGLYSVYVGFDWNLRLSSGKFLRRDISRAFHQAGLVAPTQLTSGTQRDAYLTSAGLALLADWTSQHGEPS
jgi:hypothetical protein